MTPSLDVHGEAWLRKTCIARRRSRQGCLASREARGKNQRRWEHIPVNFRGRTLEVLGWHGRCSRAWQPGVADEAKLVT